MGITEILLFVLLVLALAAGKAAGKEEKRHD